MEVITGKNAFIEFKQDEEWKLFGCADNLTYAMATELVNTVTEGSGVWDDFEGQSQGYTIDLSGLVPVNEPGMFTAWDLLNHQKQMVGIEFNIVFENAANEIITQIYGLAIVQTGSLAAPAVGFLGSSFSLRGKGEPTIGIMPVCLAEISDITVTREALGFDYHVAIDELVEGTVPQFDYRLDSGPIDTAFDTGWEINVGFYGDHVLEIWPVCENGARGVKYTYNFTTTIG
jgi:hypothetical protein